MSKKIEEQVLNTKNKTVVGLKRYLFDIISGVIILAILTASLGIFDVNHITKEELGSLFSLWVPFFLASVLLNRNLYRKGTYTGKQTDGFITIINDYSKKVNSLTGEEISEMYNFCNEYNDEVLVLNRTNILKQVGISYEWYIKKYKIGEQEYEPICTQTVENLKANFTKEQVKYILKAKRFKIKGLQVNSLMGNTTVADITNLGPTESQMSKRRFISSIVTYLLSSFVLTILAMKDIAEWGWSALILVIFKTAYTFATAYMSYFRGYDDIVSSLSNHVARKTDILKEFSSWYNTKKSGTKT